MSARASSLHYDSKPQREHVGAVQPDARCEGGRATCTFHTNHPLVFRAIKHSLFSDPGLGYSIQPYSNGIKPSTQNCKLLVLDTCSVANWYELLNKWQSEGGYTIALISPDVPHEAELELVYLGIAGIVTFSDEGLGTLPAAIQCVRQKQLWVKREVLNEYVRQTNYVLRRFSSFDSRFTTREHEIIAFLRQGQSNRKIASALRISERTVKFHVSNILRKSNIDNRRDLLVPEPQPFRLNSTGPVRSG